MTPTILILSMLTIIFLSSASSAFAQEVRIERSQMPDADQKTADEQSKGATVHGYFMEITGGQILYKVELTVNSHSRDVVIDSKGNVVKIEDEIAFDKLPAAVRKALQKKAGSGTITRTESITKLGSIVAYEAKVINDGKKSELQVSPDGKPLDHEE
jgi:uncharacterized membrane protein YkoI